MTDLVKNLEETIQTIFDFGNNQIKTEFVKDFVYNSNRVIHTNLKDAYRDMQAIADKYAEQALNYNAEYYARHHKPQDIICP